MFVCRVHTMSSFTQYAINQHMILLLCRMRALDLLTGKDKPNSPSQPLAATVNLGKLGTVTFNASQHWQRPGLTLFNSTVYAAFASHCDASEFHPWIFGIDGTTLQVDVLLLQLQ